MTTISMTTIRSHYRRLKPDGHWFDVETMRFFKTKLSGSGEKRPDGSIWFVSRETNPCDETRWSVRRMDPEGDIHTIGRFHSYEDEAAARDAMRLALAADPATIGSQP